jgi:hypothetical protein
MEFFSEYFEIVDHTEDNSVAFFYHSEIPAEKLQSNLIQSLTRTQILELANLAIARFTGHQREVLQKSRDHFQDILASEEWPI